MPYGSANGGGPGLPGGGQSSGPRIGSNGMGRKGPLTDITTSIGYTATGSDSTQLLSIGKTSSSTATVVSDPKSVAIRNVGYTPVVILTGYQAWTSATVTAGDPTSDTFQGIAYVHTLLLPGESFTPVMRSVISLNSSNTTTTHESFSDRSAWNLDGTVLSGWEAPNALAYTDSGANVDTNDLNNTTTPITIGLDSAASVNLFRVNDIIRVSDDIMRVLGTYSDDPTNSSLAAPQIRVERGLYGSDPETIAGTPDVRFPFFNTYTDFDDTLKLATDANGKWWSMNFFGYSRTDGTTPSGITPGTVCFKFYSQGYQEFGLSGISSSTNTGLAASEKYAFNITIDGGTEFADLSFTTDSSNLNFGGTNGVLSKIQAALDTQYYTAGNLFEKRVSVGIVGGDIRFTSGTHLSTSAVSLANPTAGAGETNFFGNGRIPAVANIEEAVASKLPDDTLYDPITYGTSPNMSAFAYDDGNGRIVGMCNGTINYETGEILLRNAPPIANFVFQVSYSNPFSGKMDSGAVSGTGAYRANSLHTVRANVMSRLMEGRVQVTTH